MKLVEIKKPFETKKYPDSQSGIKSFMQSGDDIDQSF